MSVHMAALPTETCIPLKFLIGGCEGSDKGPKGQSGRHCGLLACLESMLPVNAPVDVGISYGLQSFYCRALNGIGTG